MKASGNGNVMTCVNNLLRIQRGENPYERVKGLDATLIDKPTSTAIPDVQEDARWLLETYEPRADVDKLQVKRDDGTNGSLIITTTIGGEEVTNG